MTRLRKPPALLGRTLAFTFVTAAVLVSGIFSVVLVTVRDQVRETVRAHLESSQRMFAAIEVREQRERRLQAETVAESPTLKAAIDTFAAEQRTADRAVRAQLLNTISGELAKVAARVEVDAVVVVDDHERVLAASGEFGNRFRVGEPVVPGAGIPRDAIVRLGDEAFRAVAAPLSFSDTDAIGSLCLLTSLDRRFAKRLGDLAHADIVIVSQGRVVASTLPASAEPQFVAAIAAVPLGEGAFDLDDDSHAFRRLVQTGDTSFYALASIDQSARLALGSTTQSLAFIALGAICLALLGSIWLAHLLSEPIGRLSASVHEIAHSRRFDTRVPMTGSSLEIDRLAETFNDLMSSVAAAEAETEAAYTSAIRALAATLDARDPYTAGHSERVSILSVAIGRAMALPPDDIEVIRLGALLHDIGKIGVPDEILRKPGPLNEDEFDVIKQHPGLGARILSNVPFLARHVEIVELHHERPDGLGYPHGLTREQIPLGAHIVHVADAYDAMTSARAYRTERPAGSALREIWDGAGHDFHGDVVAALDMALQNPDTVLEVRRRELVSA
jgi:putative nucleotidyltransferase with HDIG domain